MIQPWIHKAKTDLIFIIGPSFFVLAIIFLFQDYITDIEDKYSFYTWLFLIVFIDVAHVYATLFKTYFVADEFRKNKRRLLLLPTICFVVGIILFSFGSLVFWSFLAYVAVFHFIRQQYGFMRLYARNEQKTKFSVFIDNLTIYASTGYPMLYWFFSSERKFNWFVENEFFKFHNSFFLEILFWVYLIIILVYITYTIYKSIHNNFFNFPKNAIILGTALSWYFGIVYFNDDLIFTLLNVVSHGLPYMALIYFREIENKANVNSRVFSYLRSYNAMFIYILILLIIAFSEEFLWEILVWNENISLTTFDFSNWQFLIVPLLSVPQFTHYLLDGFIWKSKKN
ncbi:hypothetical protein [Flavobacterium pectinovorum]|uniref:Beta-carotene 15,15'-monooxygenase n=1 Tax=Flavobacterium pectinovorum TaxID=29533 RepID=A0AB36P2M0_9FLAO|nr:hypothetical protein [Flavobacterium pectinovorum]OXB05681.1 hypothetical protein B0A72_06580 [Flavobacterium pectinovorum]SHM06316.1 hypothetical protein SAMN05444387_1825 [Flavobacterium pectinovorum]